MTALDIDRVTALLTTRRLGRKIDYVESTDTTMADAQRAAEGGADEGLVAIAEEQTAGRGRRAGRSWVSPPGVNLYFTVVLRPSASQLRSLPVIAPLAVCQAIEETTGLQPRIGWPNDVFIEQRKMCGILVQSELTDGAGYALAGIGINVNLDVAAHEEIASIATSLRSELGREASREEVLAATLNHFEALYEAAGRGEVVSPGWKQRLETLGQPVRVEIGSGVEEGTAVDADSDGSLILRRDDGSHVRIDAGEVLARS